MKFSEIHPAGNAAADAMRMYLRDEKSLNQAILQASKDHGIVTTEIEEAITAICTAWIGWEKKYDSPE